MTRVLKALERFVPLAPLHQPHNLSPIAALLERAPELPQVACFDTAFHRTNPDVAQRFALPDELHDAGVRRYGFHGLSYEYIASVLPRFDAKAAAGQDGRAAPRQRVEHVRDGGREERGEHDGLHRRRRAADGHALRRARPRRDPVPHGRAEAGRPRHRAAHLHESGLLGMSGISSDMRTLLESADPRARLAIDVYVYRIRRELGSLAGALGGLDALVFTAGIGENAPAIRERVCRDGAWLGIDLDAAANAAGGPRISAPGSRVSAWVIPTNEELMIARHTRRLLAAAGRDGDAMGRSRFDEVRALVADGKWDGKVGRSHGLRLLPAQRDSGGRDRHGRWCSARDPPDSAS